MPTKDPERRREYARASYKRRMQNPEYREKLLKGNARRKAKAKSEAQKVVDAFRENGCVCCGETEPCCLDAHHLDPDQKEITIGKALAYGYSAKRIEQELEKCVCVCSNCHRKIHADKLSVSASVG